MYIHPEEVTSPKNRLGGFLELIHDEGEGRWCVARVIWDDEPRVVARWNGDDTNPIGNPQSRGKATWFVVPEELEDPIVDAAMQRAEQSSTSLIGRYREMASDTEREQQAHEWSEALIGDPSETR